jgi:hypothetical protein
MKKLLYFTLFLLIAILTIELSLLLHDSLRQSSLFDKKHFSSKKYSQQDILLFSDIAFREADKLRKWNQDIEVEIDTTCAIDKNCVTEVDNVIKVLAPLIVPVKIHRVSKNGNLIVHMNCKNTPVGHGIGYTLVNNLNLLSEPINHADVYTIKYCLSILPHEMCHAIGLSHPTNRYQFYNIMGVNNFCVKEMNNNSKKTFPDKFALVFDTWEDMDSFEEYQKKLVIPLEERRIIKMLYSSDFKSGLKKSIFKKEMGLTDVKSK